MATQRQIEANRRNSQNSTGPRSPEGKAVSRFNALKSGIDAKALVIPGEDPSALLAISADYHRQFPPASPLECFLVDSLVHADWLLRRLRAVQARLWAIEVQEVDAGNPASNALTRIERRIDATERSFYRALKQLQRLHSEVSQDLGPPQLVVTSDDSPDLASFRNSPLAAPLAAFSTPVPAPCVVQQKPEIRLE